MIEIASQVVYDNSRVPTASDDRNRDRTIELIISESDGDLCVYALGTALPAKSGGLLHGRPTASATDIRRSISNLCAFWDREVISYKTDNGGQAAFPFEDVLDTSKAIPFGDHQNMMRRLAREGDKLFHRLFSVGDNGLQELGRQLSRALAKPQIVRITAESLFLPWSMLYTNPGGVDLEQANAQWSPEGFWGYQHLVEHALEHDSAHNNRLKLANNTPVIGMAVDRRLDSLDPNQRCIQPMIGFFEEETGRQPDLRHDRPSLASAYQNGKFKDEISYFGCHASVGGSDGSSLESAAFTLEDDDPVGYEDFEYWLKGCRLPTRPVVFINTCQGGRLSTMFYPSFGRALLDAGANCLIGPQVDVTPLFAREYALRFFRKFLKPGMCIGEIVQGLAQNLLDEGCNPLGLTISMYRGLDTHIAPIGG